VGEPGDCHQGLASGMTRAVFLDRDGVIIRAVVRNGRPYPPGSIEELELLPGVREAIEQLGCAGFRLIVVTNQPDVATGSQKQGVVEAIHERVRRDLPIDDIKVCYHLDQDRCQCRKPKPGMLLEAAAQWSLDLERCFMVGDRWRDVAAGQAAGCKTILIRYDYDERKAERPDAVVSSLLEASDLILSGKI
jgi:D-glycero-D-manno-heptose 1,7-bisphosphate phosphatase